ncbi:unnamed protein product [Acanthoscelides obtectus]|uniref:Uncharacterized protein n=1 Tax=Acanthoscelides obtectus TaxID=200917 RepID=A0A9P0M1J9_ACAOB|nr:unnamed protein product [Acanthoscelides obtectus]CAK1656964.1 hypothetical protein AOBTE_LOCUS20049 [Acanthoscelides obtectus]
MNVVSMLLFYAGRFYTWLDIGCFVEESTCYVNMFLLVFLENLCTNNYIVFQIWLVRVYEDINEYLVQHEDRIDRKVVEMIERCYKYAYDVTKGYNDIFGQFPMIMTIMSFDAIERSGAAVINTCYLLHSRAASENVMEHLRNLTVYTERWRPTFTAAGFYTVNRSCIPSIFSSLVTYLVIIIQFNVMFESPDKGQKDQNDALHGNKSLIP